jgi:hypothetical protein
MPHATDLPVMLWEVPMAFDDPILFLRFLDHIQRRNHWLWRGIVNVSDAFLDHFLPYVEPLPASSSAREIELRLIVIEICEWLFGSGDLLDGFLRRLSALIVAPPLTLAVNALRTATRLLAFARERLAREHWLSGWGLLVDLSFQVTGMKRLVLQAALSGGYPRVALAQAALQRSPTCEDIWFVATFVASDKECVDGPPLPIVQTVTVYAATDQTLARTCCKALCLLLEGNCAEVPWLMTFVRHAAGFVIIAQARHQCGSQVELVLELLAALTATRIEWLVAEVSAAAALLLASQRVSLASASGLRPAARFDTAELHTWIHADAVCLATMLLDVKEEPRTGARVPKFPLARAAPSTKSSVAMVNMRSRGPTRPIIRTNRSFRVVPSMHSGRNCVV